MRKLSAALAAQVVLYASSLLLVSMVPVERALAQTTSGTLRGQVLDDGGKGLAGAKVVIVNEENQNTRATITDANGGYEVFFLPPGLYRITSSLANYTEGTTSHFAIPLNCITPLRPPDITLRPLNQPGPVSAQPAATPTAAAVPGINTTDSTRRGNFTSDQIQSLPLGGQTDMRTFDELASLLPGVSPPPYTPGVRGPGVGFGIGTAGEFSVNGSRARSNNFTVDGSDDNDPDVGVRRQGFVALVPQSIESINELEVSTLLWDAELGRNFGSQVNAVTRNGGSRYHGEAYGFLTDSALNARNFFDYTQKDPFTRSQTGFVVGGPAWDDATQFFGSFEHITIHDSSEQNFATPTESDRRFLGLPDFGLLAPPTAINPDFQFLETKRGATPLGQNVLSFYPLPNNPGGPYGGNTFTQVIPANGTGSLFSVKVDRRFGGKNTLSARYNFTSDDRILPVINRAINSTTRSATGTQDLSLILTTQLGAGIYNNARFSYGRTLLNFSPFPGSPLVFTGGKSSVLSSNGEPTTFPSTTTQIGEVSIEPFSSVGVDTSTFPQSRADNTFQYADTASKEFGAHSIKIGVDVRRLQLNSMLDRNFRPQVVYGYGTLTTGALASSGTEPNPFTFTPTGTQLLSGVQLADLGLLPSSIFQTLTAGTPDSTIGLRFTEYNFFFNDNWRISKRVTLDYGLRYEYNTVPYDASGSIGNALSLKGLPAPGSPALDTPARVDAFNEAVAAYKQFLGGRTGIYDPYSKDIAPHAGFAWDPWGDGKTAVRAGYGIYYDAILGAVVSQSRNVFPNEIPINVDPSFTGSNIFILNTPATLKLTGASGNQTVTVPLIAPGTVNQLGGTPADFVALIGQLFLQNQRGGGLAFTLPEKNLRTPYDQQWHLTIERQIGRDLSISVAYVGSKGNRLTRLTTPNLGPNVTPRVLVDPDPSKVITGVTVPTVATDCRLQPGGLCDVQPNRPDAFLGAFEVFSNSASSIYHSLQVEARKRLSQSFSLTSSYTWSHAIDDVSDLFPIAGAPVLPEDSNNLALERASANFDMRQRFTASATWNLPVYQENSALARVLGGWQLAGIFQANSGQPFTLNVPVDANFDGNLSDRPSTTNGLTFTSGGRQAVAMAPGASVSSFVVLGQDGMVGRNTVRGDSFVNLDLALIKNFRITESQKLTFRAEFFNALNRPNFGLPIGVIGAPGFGSAVDTINPARMIQFALKYGF
jgi:hypothetical protein